MASAELPNVCAAQNQSILLFDFVLKYKSLNYKRHFIIFSGDSVLAGAVQLLQKACSKLLADEEFCTTDEVRSNIKTYNTSVALTTHQSIAVQQRSLGGILKCYKA